MSITDTVFWFLVFLGCLVFVFKMSRHKDSCSPKLVSATKGPYELNAWRWAGHGAVAFLYGGAEKLRRLEVVFGEVEFEERDDQEALSISIKHYSIISGDEGVYSETAVIHGPGQKLHKLKNDMTRRQLDWTPIV